MTFICERVLTGFCGFFGVFFEDGFDFLEERREIEWFYDVVIDSCGFGSCDIVFLASYGCHNDGAVCGARVFSERFEHFEAVHNGHIYVEEDEVRFLAGGDIEPLFSVVGEYDAVFIHFESVLHSLCDGRLVLDDEYRRCVKFFS